MSISSIIVHCTVLTMYNTKQMRPSQHHLPETRLEKACIRCRYETTCLLSPEVLLLFKRLYKTYYVCTT